MLEAGEVFIGEEISMIKDECDGGKGGLAGSRVMGTRVGWASGWQIGGIAKVDMARAR